VAAGDSNRLMTCMFRTREDAERAYSSACDRGYSERDVSVLMTEDTRNRLYPPGDRTKLGSKAAEGAGIGGVAGAGLGALLAGLAAVGIAVPGLPIIAMGPLAAALTGGAAGGTLGAIVGGLVGSGIPEERAKLYEKGVREGGIVFGVTPRNEEDAGYFEQEWRNCRGEQIYRPGSPESTRRVA
jgi:hypothetical protein